MELKAETDTLSRRQREKELMLRQYRVAETALREARDGLPNLKFQVGRRRVDGLGALEQMWKRSTRCKAPSPPALP